MEVFSLYIITGEQAIWKTFSFFDLIDLTNMFKIEHCLLYGSFSGSKVVAKLYIFENYKFQCPLDVNIDLKHTTHKAQA
jgi:hypothetical protein